MLAKLIFLFSRLRVVCVSGFNGGWNLAYFVSRCRGFNASEVLIGLVNDVGTWYYLSVLS